MDEANQPGLAEWIDGNEIGSAMHGLLEGRDAIDERRYEEAFGILSTVGPEHPQYARAQRYIGWELFGDAMDRPDAGLPYVYRAWKHQRGGNEWQDLSRTYGALLAF